MPGLSRIWCVWLISAFSASPSHKTKKRVMEIQTPITQSKSAPKHFLLGVPNHRYTALILESPSWLPHVNTF